MPRVTKVKLFHNNKLEQHLGIKHHILFSQFDPILYYIVDILMSQY